MKEKISQIKELVSELNKHRHAYYNLNAPSITDKEYDQMFDTLKKLETETGVVLSNSPTQNVGYYPVSSLNKVKHPIPLLSLDLNEVYRIFNRVTESDVQYLEQIGFYSHSLSVSDVVEIHTSPSESHFYFCDFIGFKEIEFQKEAVISKYVIHE